jgi:deazaflavin-dependent oxidoreductase (nitroreductase family)
MTPRPLMRLLERVPSVPFVEIVVVGRRSGQVRRTMVSMFDIDGHWYVGHPNGHSQWTKNIEAAGSAVVVKRGSGTQVTPVLLPDGAERDAAIRGTSGQPFPANLIYRGARRHIKAVGSYYRLEPR